MDEGIAEISENLYDILENPRPRTDDLDSAVYASRVLKDLDDQHIEALSAALASLDATARTIGMRVTPNPNKLLYLKDYVDEIQRLTAAIQEYSAMRACYPDIRSFWKS